MKRFLLIAGLKIGAVFIFCVKCWNARITQDEAQYVTATFSSYKEDLHRGHVQQIILPFEDHEQPFIDGACIDDKSQDSIQKLSAESSVFTHLMFFAT